MTNLNIAVIGLGYVGLPLAASFAKNNNVIGYDLNKERIDSIKSFRDSTNEVSTKTLKKISKKFVPTSDESLLKNVDIFIITVPTPVTKKNRPDLEPIKNASELVSRYLSKYSYVIYESTVFPGCTEEVCVPILEKGSGLKFKVDFHVGYSPERINPGDKINSLEKIIKVTSGSCDKSSKYIANLYKSIIKAGVYEAKSIKVAEAAKVIENAQRDINIAFMNELSLIFDRLGIETIDVLNAAKTKWNFLDFKPGLVGGHCIGVDPYYLAYSSKRAGIEPKVILSGRNTNNFMVSHVCDKTIELLKENKKQIYSSKILILGATFKENVPDFRNSKIFDVASLLHENNIKVEFWDPFFSNKELKINYKAYIKKPNKLYDGIIIASPHKVFIDMGVNKIKELGKKNSFIYDLKGVFDINKTQMRL